MITLNEFMAMNNTNMVQVFHVSTDVINKIIDEKIKSQDYKAFSTFLRLLIRKNEILASMNINANKYMIEIDDEVLNRIFSIATNDAGWKNMRFALMCDSVDQYTFESTILFSIDLYFK